MAYELGKLTLSAADHLWWGAVAYVVAVQVHNGLVHIGNQMARIATAYFERSKK